jgi:aminoglycoside phosphotransferase (APT) family kinase protein
MLQRSGRDLDLTRERLAAWLATKLPDAAHLRLSPLASPSFTGFSNDTLLFDLTWEERGEERTRGLVVRIEPSGLTVFPEYDLARQFRVMEILRRTDVPVPGTLWLEEDRGVLGAPFYVMERVEGRIPTDTPPYHIGGWMTEIEPAERAAIWWSGLEALARIHRVDWSALGLDFLTPPPPGATSLERQLRYYERYLEWAARGKPQPTCEPALAWLSRHRPRDPEPVALGWGDARLGNMIFHESRCIAVLDWEMATLGNPEQDLAWWLYFDRHHSEGCGAARLPGFPSREETVARYEEWTCHPVRHLDYYEIFAAFRFAVIMIRVAQQLVSRGVLLPDSDFETNNTATGLLARLLDFAPPGDQR